MILPYKIDQLEKLRFLTGYALLIFRPGLSGAEPQ